MTEDEAKTKWCPFTRVANGGVATNRDFDNGGDLDAWPQFKLATACVGSACMAWVQTDNEAPPSKPGDPEPVYKSAGRCGLVGRS